MTGGLAKPRRLDLEALELLRAASEQRLITVRDEEGPANYLETYETQRELIDSALELTDDLLAITSDDLLSDHDVWQTLRYCCAPPVSEEDLWTVVGKKFKRVPREFASRTAEALSRRLDPVRFPWVREGRPPSADERERAAMATAVLLTSARLGTARRGSASTAQEALVASLLVESGYVLEQSRNDIRFPDELGRQTFSSERKLAGSKCDLPVRLRDGRLLAIECKVSNGPKNGWKRLHREVGGKAQDWRSRLGSQVVTCAVIGGSFDLSCLRKAQDEFDIFIVFDHDLDPLRQFLDAAR